MSLRATTANDRMVLLKANVNATKMTPTEIGPTNNHKKVIDYCIDGVTDL